MQEAITYPRIDAATRLARLERASKLPAAEAEAFTALLARMRADESRNLELHASLITGDTASG